ncbi:hypothetical protein GCM10011374_04830 [Kocuria dechangensis]|uniref:Uncharacterized protein n=1 Tax=Kocuria dechangensis TaxID=1176249 RepID=A0A917GGY3_9MICC|nr:hypothetical protein [Kocuria dechangensis]GGG45589.1 hypothetical protein GCM10011374_04830 [Kocuria dechangensis]
MTSVNPSASALRDFDATTARWGRLTMIAGLLFALAGPTYLVFFSGLEVDQAKIWTALLAIAGTFGVLWFVEPLTYYPILGQASMYQAFMIGNISNKLLPSALIAQSAIGAKPGTRRGELAAVMAIGGAAMVHLISLLVFVGFLGSWLVSVVPAEIIAVVQTYILPSVLGAVLVQAIVSTRNLRVTVIAGVVAASVVFLLVPAVPTLAFFGTAIAVISTAVLAWFLRDRSAASPSQPVPEREEEPARD